MNDHHHSETNSAGLHQKLKQSHRRRPLAALGYLLLGLLGLVLPVIPGLLFIGLAFWMLFPNQAEKVWAGIQQRFEHRFK